jgi:hypothetical protein
MAKKRSRRQKRAQRQPVSTTDYTDVEGNVLTLRDSLTPGTIAKILEPPPGAALNQDDLWRRRQELTFERLAVRWVIAGLPLEEQSMLLGRYRMASPEERRWVRETMAAHLERHIPELA